MVGLAQKEKKIFQKQKMKMNEMMRWGSLGLACLMVFQVGVVASTNTGSTALNVTVANAPMPILSGVSGLTSGGIVKAIKLSWSQPSGDFDGYQVRWRKVGAGVWNETEVNSTNTVSAIITDLEIAIYETQVLTVRDGSGGVAVETNFAVVESEETGSAPNGFVPDSPSDDSGKVRMGGSVNGSGSVAGAADFSGALSGSTATSGDYFWMQGGDVIISSWLDSDRKVTIFSGSTAEILGGSWSGEINPPVILTSDAVGDFGLGFVPTITFGVGDADAKLDFGSGTSLQPLVQISVSGGCSDNGWVIQRQSLNGNYETDGITFVGQEVSGSVCLVSFRTRYMSKFVLNGVQGTPDSGVLPGVNEFVPFQETDTGGAEPDESGHPEQPEEEVEEEIAIEVEVDVEVPLVLDKILEEGEEAVVVSDKKARDMMVDGAVMTNKYGERVVVVTSSRWVPSENGAVKVEGEEKEISLVVDLQEGSVISNNYVFYGLVGADARVVLVLKMEDEGEKIWGMARSDEEGFYVFDDLKEMPEGEYGIEVRVKGEGVKVEKVKVKSVSEIGFEPVVISVGKEIVSSWSGALGGEILVGDRYPLIRGRVDFGNTKTSQVELKGVALWRSKLLASTFLVNEDGTFVVTPPKALEDGMHKVTIFVTDEETKESVVTQVDFEVREEIREVEVGDVDEKVGDEKWMVEGETVIKSGLVLVLLGMAYFVGRRMRG